MPICKGTPSIFTDAPLFERLDKRGSLAQSETEKGNERKGRERVEGMNRNERDRQTNKSETHVRFNLALLLFLKEAERTSNFGKHEYYSNELSAPLSIASTRPNIAQKKKTLISLEYLLTPFGLFC